MSQAAEQAESAPEKSAQITFEKAEEQAEEQAQTEIRAYLSAINPYDLQQMVADLLKAMGYYPSWVSPPGPDGGLDIVAHPDPLGTRPPRIKVQIKRNSQVVDESGLRSFLALVNEDDAGLFVAIGGFTKAARDAARMQERRKVTLIDLDRLLELWIEHYSKLDDLARERLPLTPIYFLTPRCDVINQRRREALARDGGDSIVGFHNKVMSDIDPVYDPIANEAKAADRTITEEFSPCWLNTRAMSGVSIRSSSATIGRSEA